MKQLLAASLLLPCLFMGGCSQNETLAALEGSVAATEVLVATLSATGKITPAVAVQISHAIEGLPDAFQKTVAELSTLDAPALKATKIVSYYTYTLSALNSLPPEAQVWTNAVVAAINAFLRPYQPTGKLMLSAARTSPAADVARLDKIRGRVVEVTEKVALLQR